MRKRILSFFIAFILIIPVFCGYTSVTATGGLPDLSVHGPIKIEGGYVSWEAYPGAAYYEIGPMGEYPGEKTNATMFYPEDVLSAYSCEGGAYIATITAYNSAHVAIAQGISGSYPYYVNGTMSTPTDPHWDGLNAAWNKVAGAESYKIDLYVNGIKTDSLYNTGDYNFATLQPWLMDYDSAYQFKVAARKPKYAISPMSSFSSSRRGRVARIAGSSRYATGRLVADRVRSMINGGNTPFDNVVIANGEKFPDALGGAYLSWQKKAPIILVNGNTVGEMIDYVKNNVKSGGTVYVLGGEGAVSESWLTPLSAYKIHRFSGSDRYATNLNILKETGVPDKRLLICTGENFADALSASGVDYPIMLVNNSGLSDEQKFFLDNVYNLKVVILGGTGAVSSEIENELKSYATIEKRISGASRYDTSIEIAKYFFSYFSKAVISTGTNFPDGLTGGFLAHQTYSPLILAANDFPTNYKIYSYLESKGIIGNGTLEGYILGGQAAVSDGAVFEIYNGGPSDLGG